MAHLRLRNHLALLDAIFAIGGRRTYVLQLDVLCEAAGTVVSEAQETHYSKMVSSNGLYSNKEALQRPRKSLERLKNENVKSLVVLRAAFRKV